MHLTPYPKLVRSECRLDAGSHPPSQRSSLFVSQPGPLLRTCSSNHGNTSGSRLPLSVICTNTLSLRLKAAPSGALQPSPLPYGENDALGLYQAAAEEADAPMDIWAVIKPGHVREKIAIFASDAPKQTDAAADRNRSLSSGSERRTPPVCANHTPLSAPPRATKAKGIWEETSNAKRRRRSGNPNPQPDRRIAPQQCLPAEEAEPQKVSVGEMVAFLEQRANEQQPDSKPLLGLQRSSTTITLARPPPSDARQGSEVKGEESESLRVSDMVAKLESECLRRRAEGELSRSNSLRRTVGRVLLVATEQSPASSPPASSQRTSPASQPSGEPTGRTDTLATPSPAPASDVEVQKVGGARVLETQSSLAEAPPPQLEGDVEEEPLPGLLFLPPPPAASLHTHSVSSPHTPNDSLVFDPTPSPPRTSSSGQSERKKADRGEEEAGGGGGGVVSRRSSVSQDFLEMRQRLQQLLEPQPLLAVLPHHLLVKIFLLLPTQSLAALKCTCHYFKFIIENYGVRPADSLWVSDPRYRDDPCKQCKRRYGRGDVSLCRWHHKPYCQALPYGPGYWMCCHGAHRDAPGCNVGLHDNRWVPAFHSINVPIYRRSREDN